MRSIDSLLPATREFWTRRGLPRWEQTAFRWINVPFSVVGHLVSSLISVVWGCPLGLIVMVPLQLVWFVCLGCILALSWSVEHAPVVRPVAFVLALPFLILGYLANVLSPARSPTDILAQREKWDALRQRRIEPHHVPLVVANLGQDQGVDASRQISPDPSRSR